MTTSQRNVRFNDKVIFWKSPADNWVLRFEVVLSFRLKSNKIKCLFPVTFVSLPVSSLKYSHFFWNQTLTEIVFVRLTASVNCRF